MDFMAYKQQFEPIFSPKLAERLQVFLNLTHDTFLNDLALHTQQILAGGKRLRPYLAYIGFMAGGGAPQDHDRIIALGVSLEFFHAFCLIHDDVIDKAKVRRGVPTIEHYTLLALESAHRHGDLAHIARGQAILLGDLLHAYSLETLVHSVQGVSTAEGVMKEFYQMIDEVIAGQMIDVDTMTRPEHDAELLERKMYLKTASYSFVRPFTLGLRLAGVSNTQAYQDAERIGMLIGIAFQLQDDLLDVIGTEEMLGKPVLSDIRDGQQTLLTAHVAEHGDEIQQALLQCVMQGKASDDQVFELRDVMRQCGAVAAVEVRIETLLRDAERAIEQSVFSEEVKVAFVALLTLLRNRST